MRSIFKRHGLLVVLFGVCILSGLGLSAIRFVRHERGQNAKIENLQLQVAKINAGLRSGQASKFVNECFAGGGKQELPGHWQFHNAAF